MNEEKRKFIVQEYRKLVAELESELSSKNKRLAELERFVGDVLRLSRYPWMHPESAEETERLMVQDLLQRAWYLLPTDQSS